MANSDETDSSLEDASGMSSEDQLLKTSSIAVVPGNTHSNRVYTRSCSLWARKREDRTPSSAGCVGQSPKDKGDNEANHSPSAKSSLKRGSPLELPKMDLKALFDYHARQKKRKWKKQEEALSPERKEATKCKTPRKRAKRRPPSAPLEERKRRCKERGFHFPFVKKLYGRKQIPLRMVYQYENSALKGFFEYIKMLKYEHHLKNALSQLDAGEDLEDKCLVSRKHKYLDDDGSLSPIEETNDDDQNENSGDKEEIGARIVENSSFILSSNIPQKKKSKKKTKA